MIEKALVCQVEKMDQVNEYRKDLGQGIIISCYIIVPFGDDIDQETKDGFMEDILHEETGQQNGLNGWYLNNSWVTKNKPKSYKGFKNEKEI